MLNSQERNVVIFLLVVIFVGIGIDYLAKGLKPLKEFLTLDENFVRIDINQASLSDLVASRCLSPRLAQSLIAYRDTNGYFTDFEELEKIKGIGKRRLEKIKEVFFVP